MKPWYAIQQKAAIRRRARKANAAFQAAVAGKPVQPTKTLLKNRLWAITSLLVRRRDRAVFAGYCLICMTKQRMCILKRAPNPISCCYHIFPSGDASVQWDLENLVGACGPCNMGEMESRHSNRESFRLRYKAIHMALLGPEKYYALEAKAATTVQFSTADLSRMIDERKAQMEGRI